MVFCPVFLVVRALGIRAGHDAEKGPAGCSCWAQDAMARWIRALSRTWQQRHIPAVPSSGCLVTVTRALSSSQMKIYNNKLVPDDFVPPAEPAAAAAAAEAAPPAAAARGSTDWTRAPQSGAVERRAAIPTEPVGQETTEGLRALVGPEAAHHPGLNIVCRVDEYEALLAKKLATVTAHSITCATARSAHLLFKLWKSPRGKPGVLSVSVCRLSRSLLAPGSRTRRPRSTAPRRATSGRSVRPASAACSPPARSRCRLAAFLY